MSKTRSDTFSVRALFSKSAPAEKGFIALATWFGSGLLPVAPGTFGTLAAVPLVIGLHAIGPIGQGVGLIALCALAIRASDRYQNLSARPDPPEVVIDEVAGFGVCLFLLPLSGLTLAAGFILFRLFDILKPYPIRRVERTFKGGWGIVADDLLAGLYAHLSLRGILWIVT